MTGWEIEEREPCSTGRERNGALDRELLKPDGRLERQGVADLGLQGFSLLEIDDDRVRARGRVAGDKFEPAAFFARPVPREGEYGRSVRGLRFAVGIEPHEAVGTLVGDESFDLSHFVQREHLVEQRLGNFARLLAERIIGDRLDSSIEILIGELDDPIEHLAQRIGNDERAADKTDAESDGEDRER